MQTLQRRLGLAGCSCRAPHSGRSIVACSRGGGGCSERRSIALRGMTLAPARLLGPSRTRDCCPCLSLTGSGRGCSTSYARPAPGRLLVACSASRAAATREQEREREREQQQEEDDAAGVAAAPAPAQRWRSTGFKQNPPPWMSRGSGAPPGPARRQQQGTEVEAEERAVSSDGVDSGLQAGKRTAMSRIVDKLQSIRSGSQAVQGRSYLGYTQQQRRGAHTADSIFTHRPGGNNQVLPKVNPKWTTPDHPVPTPGFQESGRMEARFPWEMRPDEDVDAEAEAGKVKKVKPPSLAELTISGDELKRLRGLGLHLRHRLKIGRHGVTDGVVDFIHDGWRNSEIVKIKCEGPPALNMKKTHEDLERKTGGLVVWRSGGAAIIYRGKDYVHPSKLPESVLEKRRQAPLPLFRQNFGIIAPETVPVQQEEGKEAELATSEQEVREVEDRVGVDQAVLESGVSRDAAVPETREGQIRERVLTEIVASSRGAVDKGKLTEIMMRELEEVERILEDLGPRYEGWTGARPVPVDGDLLPIDESAFKKPYRLLPYGVKPNLTNNELTDLRRLARPLPPHFVLGRNRGLVGLATAILKLWERSEIAKIAVKRGVQNTNNERMAEELKRYTGGVLLSRNKEFIVLYRGKDFLPPLVAAALQERDAMTKALQEEEERLRFRGNASKAATLGLPVEQSKAGTLAETLEVKSQWQSWIDTEEEQRNRKAAKAAARRYEVERIERKVQQALMKKTRAEDALMKVEKSLELSGPPADAEYITDEERYMFRKVGLKMKAFLLIGRRGVFDGVVENMHLHWKHRELVKIIIKEKDPRELEYTAKMLAYESGGVLIATVAVSKGQAIIVYRGKNYQRPLQIRPRHLLTKRQALKRSIELQRKKALERHILSLEKEISTMRSGIDKYAGDDGDQEFRDVAQSVTYSDEQSQDGGLDTGEFSGDGGLDTGEFSGEDSDSETFETIYRAEPLSTKERLVLRRHALKVMGKTANFNVGKSNVLTGLAAAIRKHFKRNALVKIGVNGRANGTSVQELAQELEALTGGVLVSQEQKKIIMFRGWAEGQPKPAIVDDEISPELLDALKMEDTVEEDDSFMRECQSFEGDDLAEDSEVDSEDDSVPVSASALDSGSDSWSDDEDEDAGYIEDSWTDSDNEEDEDAEVDEGPWANSDLEDGEQDQESWTDPDDGKDPKDSSTDLDSKERKAVKRQNSRPHSHGKGEGAKKDQAHLTGGGS